MSWEDDDLMNLETVATKPALQHSDPIPTSDISPIPSPGMRFSRNCFKIHLSREDVMPLETPANRARPSTFRANPSTFRDWDELHRSSEQYKWWSSRSQLYLGRGGGVKNSQTQPPPVISFLVWVLQVICLMVLFGFYICFSRDGFYIIRYYNYLWICEK